MGMEPLRPQSNQEAGDFVKQMAGVFKKTKAALEWTTEGMKRYYNWGQQPDNLKVRDKVWLDTRDINGPTKQETWLQESGLLQNHQKTQKNSVQTMSPQDVQVSYPGNLTKSNSKDLRSSPVSTLELHSNKSYARKVISL